MVLRRPFVVAAAATLAVGGAVFAMWRHASLTPSVIAASLASSPVPLQSWPAVRKGVSLPDDASLPGTGTTASSRTKPVDPLHSVLASYRAGQYQEAEVQAEQVLRSLKDTPNATEKTAIKVASTSTKLSSSKGAKAATSSVSVRRTVARARQLMAFSAARRKDLKLARERFALVVQEAAQLPEGGKDTERPVVPGEGPRASLAETASFQHAVCTAALGDKAGAEQEYIAFMRQYPESPLVHAAVKRIARMHGGDIPKPAEAVWKQAMATARSQEKEQQRQQSLCGPECLAELLMRQKKRANTTLSDDEVAKDTGTLVEKLAREMKTSDRGTSIAALVAAAKKHGFPNAAGYELTGKGLAEQELPIIALVTPGHFVLVERIGEDGSITFWDSSDNGLNSYMLSRRLATTVQQSGSRSVTSAEWQQMWSGISIVLRKLGR